MAASSSLPDKSKALDLAMAQIDKQFGKGSVMRLGERPSIPMAVIPTGSIALDVALGVGGLPRGRIVEIYGPESSGKCLTADTYVWSDRGLETVAELFERCGQPASCTSRVTDVSAQGVRMVNERGELEQVAALTHNNRKPVIKLTLRSGRTITATKNHPLRVMTERGFIAWRTVGTIQPGDFLVSAIFGAAEAAHGDGLSEDEAVLLGYLVAEGSLSYEHSVRFTNWDPEVSGEYCRLMEQLFGVEIRNYGDKEFVASGKPLQKRFAEEYGMDYVTAHGKTVPHRVRTGGHKIQRAFLSALFEGDGWIDPSSTIGLGTASEQLAREVQLLLYGLGIPATVSSKWNEEYRRDYWSVTIDPAVVHRFLAEVGFRSARRRAQVERNFRTSPRDAQFENIPHLRGLIQDLRDDCGGDREFDRIAGDLFRQDINLACSQTRLAKIVEWGDQRWKKLSPSGHAILIHFGRLMDSSHTYEEVVAVADGGSQPTFDVMLPQTHSFIANGVLSHNTTVALHAVASAQKSGGIAAFIDAEHALDPDYARALGVDTDALLVSQPDTGEQALEIADMLVRSGALDIIVIDSVAALVPRAEIEGEMGDSHVGLQARLMSQALRKITGVLSNSNTTAIFINQLREKIGVMFGSPETTTGGKALKFYSSVRLDVRRIESLKDGTDVVGNRTRVKVVKNKCLAEGTTLFDPTTGRTHKIEEVVDGRLPVSVVATAKDGMLHVRPVTSWFDQGEQDVIGIRLRGGATLWATPDHKVLTERGWKLAGDLTKDDRVAQPRRFLGFGEYEPYTPDQARMLGYLIGDGYVGGKTPLQFINVQESLKVDATRIAATLGCNTHTHHDKLAISFSHRKGERNELLELCRRAGIYGKLAWEKTIPVELFHAEVSQKVVGNILFGLFESDGWVSKEQTGAIRIGYGTTSEQLAYQIHWLLMRYGVASSVRHYDPTSQRPSIIDGRRVQGKRLCYEVRVAGSDNVEAFADAVPMWGPRGQALRAALETTTGRRRGSQAVYLSRSLTEPILARLANRQITPTFAAMLIGPAAGDPRGGMKQVLGLHQIRRDRLQLLADALDDTFLQELLTEEIRYASIREILPARRARTFDIEVDELHTFVANSIIVHNCASPFKQAEFDIMYGKGISREGSLIDVGVEQSIIRKSGAWYTYDGDQLGQGKENARNFLKENPDVAAEIEKRILEKLGVGQASDEASGTPLPPVDF